LLIDIDVPSIANFPDDHLFSRYTEQDAIIARPNPKIAGQLADKGLGATNIGPFPQAPDDIVNTRLDSTGQIVELFDRLRR
jgi:hypothetical protein